jgi:aspartate/methionine/tyrosine aminotransferase
MGEARRVLSSEYMEWAKTRADARFNLATSGVSPCPIRELGVTLEDIDVSGPSLYGYEPLQRALAKKCGVSVDSVVAAVGTSLANHLAMAAVVEPGDEVLMEHPVYEPLLALARYLGAQVTRFERRPAAAFRIEPREIARKISGRTRLIVISNLHNPSGALTEEPTLEALRDIARQAGARVLVDEVYLEMLWAHPTRSAFHLGREFIVTGSLTKAYGLSGLRCGWILAEPELAKRMWRLCDLFTVIPAHAAERLSVVALGRLDHVRDRARTLLDRNRALLDRFLDSRPDLLVTRPGFGTVVFPRWAGGDTTRLCDLLRTKYETTVVPGRFFGMPDHFRIGIGGETDMTSAALERLTAALDDLAAVS